VAFSTLFGRTGTDPVTLSQANLPSFNLDASGLATESAVTAVSINASTNGGATGANFEALNNSTTLDVTSNTRALTGTLPSGGSGTSFTPAIDCRVQYVDCCIFTHN
jgi:hypothetical protein